MTMQHTHTHTHTLRHLHIHQNITGMQTVKVPLR